MLKPLSLNSPAGGTPRPFWRGLALSALVACALALGAAGWSQPAMAQTEPTLKQIYDTAAAGNLPQAQTMVQQVLVAHPKSAKAHFVQAELFTRQGNLPRAREALAQADTLEPGLPFVKPEVVQALRQRLEARPVASTTENRAQGRAESATAKQAVAPAPASFPLGWAMMLIGPLVAVGFYFLLRKKPVAAPPSGASAGSFGPGMAGGAAPYNTGAPGGGLSGPQTFGTGGMPAPSPYGQGYAQPGYGQQPAQQPGGMMSGMGGRVAGGLATGLAVGAGVMAAQAIGRSFSGNDSAGHGDKAAGSTGSSADAGHAANPGSLAGEAGDPMGVNRNAVDRGDMGGQNFGFNDAAGSSWDSSGGGSDDSFVADAGGDGGGDWDT